MSWANALIYGVLMPLLIVALIVIIPRKRKPPVIKSSVGGCWMMNHDWNVRSRK